MKLKNLNLIAIALLSTLMFISCDDDDDMMDMNPDFTGTFAQADQMGRPAVNTVFVSSEMASPGSKDNFNKTIPSQQGAAFQSMFENNLLAVSPAFNNATDANVLGQTANALTTLLATDVLNVSLDKPTTFFDGTNLLTGRALADDVISTELLLIFGGESGTEYPTLSDDHVDANDKSFLNQFPYLASPW